MEPNEESGYNLIDIAVKRLVRDNPAAFLELIGFPVTPNHIKFEDTAIQQRERRADHTCILTNDNGQRRGVIYLEYQMIPGQAVVREWIWKWAGLLQRFPEPVVMLVVYMNRGHYATFHQDHSELLEGLETALRFNTVRFWECAPQIRTGKYPDFIPLLTLCEDRPTEATVREQVALIQNQALDQVRKQELLSLSFILASRDIAQDIILRVVKEVFTMNTLPPIVEAIFGDALRERERQRVQEAEERAEKRGEERGEKRGEERGEKRGEVFGTRETLIRLYARRLGAPSAEVVARLEGIESIDALHEMIDRYDEQIESWEQLFA